MSTLNSVTPFQSSQSPVRVELALGPGSARFARLGPNHHLWRNGRLWWIAYTEIHDGWRQERVRRSLGTADVDEARRRRDAILLSVVVRACEDPEPDDFAILTETRTQRVA